MKEYAEVAEADEREATIVFRRKKSCSGCNACGMGRRDEVRVTLDNPIGAESGDMVELYIAPRRALAASFLAYGFPLIMMIVGAFIGNYLPGLLGLDIPRDYAAAGCALLLTALGWCIIMLNSAKIKQAGMTLSISAVVPKNDGEHGGVNGRIYIRSNGR